jgi:hypothetical protein
MAEHEHLDGGHIGIEPMCKHCGYIGIEKRVDIPGAMEKVILLQRISYILMGSASPFWLVLVALHCCAIYWVTRASNQIETVKFFCANCGVPYDQ